MTWFRFEGYDLSARGRTPPILLGEDRDFWGMGGWVLFARIDSLFWILAKIPKRYHKNYSLVNFINDSKIGEGQNPSFLI